tara:strand:+ start:675 stop:1733 length:1059 start_codon:yes stop_codon:yes gene_type:complete
LSKIEAELREKREWETLILHRLDCYDKNPRPPDSPAKYTLRDNRNKFFERNKLALARRRIAATSIELTAVQAKIERISTYLKPIIVRYSKLSHPTICRDVRNRLPRELRDMIYTHVGIAHLPTEYHIANFPKLGVQSPTCDFFEDYKNENDSNKPWYLCPDTVGADMAAEAVQLLYRKSKFLVNDHQLLARLLNEDRWKTGTLPKDFIRHVELRLFRSDYEDDNAHGELIASLRSLKCLENGASIVLNLELNKAWRGHIRAQKDEKRWEYRPADSGSGDTQQHAERDFKEKLLLKLSGLLLPVLNELKGSVYSIALRTYEPWWEFVLGKNENTETEVVAAWKEALGEDKKDA